MNRTLIGVLAGAILLSESAFAMAGELGKLALKNEPLKLLGGRVLVKMPAGAKIEARQAPNIMAATPATETEGRIVLDAGKERFVLMAYETFAWADKDFKATVEKGFPDCTLTAISKEDADPKSYLIVPKEIKQDDEATAVASALVVLPDKTVVFLVAYVNPEAFKDLPGCSRLAQAILTSAVGGNVPLDRKGWTRRIRVEGDKDLEVSLPEDCVITRDEGIDFSVTYLRLVSAYGAPSASVLVYEGGHPSYIYARTGEDNDKKPEVKSVAGLLLGRNISWKSWTSTSKNGIRIHMEGMIEINDHTIVHVHYSSENAEAMKVLEKTVQSMKLVEKVKPASDTKKPTSGATSPASSRP